MDPAASATDSREPSKSSFDSLRCKGLSPWLCSHTPSRNALPDHLTLHILEVLSSPSIEEVPVSQHPWSNLEHRTFWTGRRPKRHWPKVFHRRPPPPLPSDARMGKVSRCAVPPPSPPHGIRLRMATQRVQGDDGRRNPCWELPGHAAGKRLRFDCSEVASELQR